MTAIYGNSVTPFTDAGDVDEALLRRHLRFMADGGVGIYLCGHGSGEGDLLTHAERADIFRVGVDEVGGRVPVGAFVGLTGPTSEIVSLAGAASAAGVDAVQVVGPRPGPRVPLDRELERYFRDVLEAVTCEVHIADNVALTGYELPMPLLETLIGDYPHVTAVNYSGPVDRLHGRIDALPDRIAVRAGITASIATVHALGGAGLLIFEPNIAPELVVGVWEGLGAASGPPQAQLATLLRLNQVLSRFGNPRSLKAAIRALGRDAGVPRPPYLPLDPADAEVLGEELRRLGIAVRLDHRPAR
jgi:4-hydroxy-tetrahydrodipicolinate synthase